MKKKKEGQVSYGPRGFHQDAAEAMKQDIVRGLVEAITNSDDSYGSEKGRIWIGVEHRHGPWKVIVRDRACGMRGADLENKIAKLAERTSGFEHGKAVRGNLGRGAKDLAAFGTVHFESIRDDRYSALVLKRTGKWSLEVDDRKATKEHREALHINRNGSGTSVTIDVNERISCPRHQRLKETLENHYALRDIMADSRRDVILCNSNDGEQVTLRYTYPSLPIVFQEEVAVQGYPATASITIYRNEERYDEPATETTRTAGLLVKGKRAIYENSLFKYENNVHAGWFSGHVECQYIDQLAREYDDRFAKEEQPTADNPEPIIGRTRDGLQSSHPFCRALAKAVEGPLGKLVEAEEKKAKESGAKETARMRRSLDALGRDLVRLMNEDLREIDAEELTGTDAGEAPPIKVIPGEAVLYMGENKTLTIQVRADVGVKEATVEVDPEGVVELLDSGPLPLEPHPKWSTLLVGRIRVRPLVENKQTLMEITAGTHSVVAVLEVEPERHEEDEVVEPPDSLQFERDSYRVTLGKKRTLKLVAPPDVVADHGHQGSVTSGHTEVVVLGGGSFEFKFDDSLEYYVAEAVLEGRQLGAKATITAKLGSASATCNLIVARDDGGPSMHIEVRDREIGNRRALVETTKEVTEINIMGLHPAIKRYLGPAPEFPKQDEPLCRALIAEIVASECARIMIERKHQSTDEHVDAAAMYVEHYMYLTRYLNRCHRILVTDAALP